MKKETLKAQSVAQEAKVKYSLGVISRETAKELIQPYLDIVNTKAKELAKKYDQKFRAVHFVGFVR